MGYKKLFSFYYFIHFSVNLKQTKKTEVKYNLFKRKEEGKREGKKRQDGGKVAERKKNEREREVWGGKESLFYIKSLPGSLYSTSSGRVAYKSLCRCLNLPFVFLTFSS